MSIFIIYIYISQLEQCKANLGRCIKLVEEAAGEIEELETRLEAQKTHYEERILNVEAELAVTRMEAEDWRGSEPPPQLGLELISDEDDDEEIENDDNYDDESEVDESPEERDTDSDRTTLMVTRNVYYDSVQTYRKIIALLETKIKTAETVWREITATISNILTDRKFQANVDLGTFISEVYRSNLVLRDIFDISNIYNDIETEGSTREP